MPDAAPSGGGCSRQCGNSGGGAGFWGLCAGFALAYLSFLIAVQTRVSIEDWEGRYLAPAYIPLLVTAVFALDRLLSYAAGRNLRGGRLPVFSAVAVKSRVRMDRLPAIGVALALCAWLAWGAVANVRDIWESNFYGTGLSGRKWANSEFCTTCAACRSAA